MKVGQNDPCPCGSGIKYKKCCAGKTVNEETPGGAGSVLDELREALQAQNFASIEEASAFMTRHMAQRNSSRVNDFTPSTRWRPTWRSRWDY
jgi:hypothetical protein